MSNATNPHLPHNREAEEGLLGSILILPEVYYEVADFLNPDNFYIHRHRWIWEALTALAEKNIRFDFITLMDELERQGHLADIGGSAYLTRLLTAPPTALHAAEYAKIVAETATRRRMLEAASQIARAAVDISQPLEDSLNTAEAALFDVTVAAKSLDRDLLPTAQLISQIYDDISKTNGQTPPGLSTSLADLDHLLGGLRPSDLIVLAARPGIGKTALLLTIIRHIGLHPKKTVVFFSLEMDREILTKRLISQDSGIPLERIRDHRLLDEDWAPFTASTQKLTNIPLFIDDSPTLTPARIRSKCRQIAMTHDLSLVAVDYLQLMHGERRFENRTQEVAHISRQLKILARELRVPLLAAAQLSRAVEHRQDKRPTLADLRESGAIEQDSDIVMFLYRSPDNQITKLAVEKHRNGPTGVIDLIFLPQTVTFVNAARY